MSDAEHREREWRFYPDDMMAFAQKVQSYTDGLEQTEFVADGRTYDATLRNHLIHGYLGIDDDTLWSIIRDDILYKPGEPDYKTLKPMQLSGRNRHDRLSDPVG